MYYLHLKFRNSGLIQCGSSMGKSTSPQLERDKNIIGEYVKNDQNFGHDVTNPIPYTLLSNVLHVLCGEIPVPTKRQSLFQRIPILDEIAKNSFVKYDSPLLFNKFGKIANIEFFQTQKWQPDSTLKIQDTFTLHDGTTKKIDGWYNWDYFRRGIRDKEARDIIINFIESIINVNPLKLTLKQTVFELSKYWDTNDFKNSLDAFLSEHKKLYTLPWLKVFFNTNATGRNTAPDSSTPLTNCKGVGGIVYLNGEIICPFDSDDIYNAIVNNGCGVSNLLEQGIVYVVGLEKYHPYGSFSEDWVQIF